MSVFLKEERDPGPHALSQDRAGPIQLRCGSCDLEWESAHYQEECPLRQLETVFLPEDWLMEMSEPTS
ncbi:MAG: hypothetical protein ABIP82_07455 [Nitrospirales bacterium]